MSERQVIVVKDGSGCLPGCGAAGCGAVLGTLITLALVVVACAGLLALIAGTAGQGK